MECSYEIAMSSRQWIGGHPVSQAYMISHSELLYSSGSEDIFEMTKRKIGKWDPSGPSLGTHIKAKHDVVSGITGYNDCSAGTVLKVTSTGISGVIARPVKPISTSAYPPTPPPGSPFCLQQMKPVILKHSEYDIVSRWPSTGIFAED